MRYCIATETSDGKVRHVFVFSSRKKREAYGDGMRGRSYFKLNVPATYDANDIAKAWRGGTVARASKPQRRSIAWIEQGMRLHVEIAYPETCQ